MWGVSEEPPGTMEEGPPEPLMQAKEKCEQNKSQLESLKEIMLKNKETLKKKEVEVQEYARRLSKIKSRAKISRRSKEGTMPSRDPTHSSKSDLNLDISEDAVDDISQAKTAKAKSTLLQKKLAENRKAFEQRSKELTESKRAVEEKVEAIRQQLEEKDTSISGLQKDQLPITPIRPVVVTSDVMSPIQIGHIQEKDNQIGDLNNKILVLEATILDLQENLKEKDSVIESKTRAVTLMSADLSRRGKTTLDTLEDTKDEMRTMQEHFVLLETSLKNKNENLLVQLQERDGRISELHEEIESFKQQINEQKLSESASADFSRSTMDTLVETKDAMKSMQENFVLIESSLKVKNDNLLQQLQEYENKLAEANERIFQFESGVGIVKDPSTDDLLVKLGKLEHNNKLLQDEKYELQKSIAEMQDKIVNRSVHGNGAIMEKDNRIAELENLVEELKQSNKLLEEESKAELQKQVSELTVRNEEYSNKVTDLENQVHELEAEKNDIIAKLPDESSATREQEKVAKLTKELEELNKGMIKIKAQHRSKIKNLQKQLENFKMVSDTNAELVRLGNQVALLEEEKGNLQLSLVDFDELKASAGDWQERIADLESKVSAQTKEIQMHIEAIATLENQKLDLTQELHTAKQEISALEVENADSENLRVTAEMKIVDLEEQLECTSKGQSGSKQSLEAEDSELVKRIEALSQENSELYSKITKMEEKATSDTGSTESFEAIHETDKNEFLKKIEDLLSLKVKLSHKLSKLQDKVESQGEPAESSFEALSAADKDQLLKKISILTQENADLIMQLSRFEEKGSSDTGSTESFERIPEHNENLSKIELLTQENSELVIKLTKLEEQLEYLESSKSSAPTSEVDTKLEVERLIQENKNQSGELTRLKVQATELAEENTNLQTRVEALIAENSELAIMHTKLEERFSQLQAETIVDAERAKREVETKDQVDVLMQEKSLLEKEVKELRNVLEQSRDVTERDSEIESLKTRIDALSEENAQVLSRIAELEGSNEQLKESLDEVSREKEELRNKINEMTSDEFADERLQIALIEELEKLNREKESVAQEKQGPHEQISTLLLKSNEELSESRKIDESVSQEKESMIVASLEQEIEDYKKLINEQTSLIEEMKTKLASKEKELEEKGKLIIEYEASGKRVEDFEGELKDMLSTVDEWKYKCNDMQEKMQMLEAGKASIEEGLKMLQSEKEMLLEEKQERETASKLLKQELEDNIGKLESRLEEELATISAKDNDITNLKEVILEKDQELNVKYTQLQNGMIAIDNLQEQLINYKGFIQEKDNALTSLTDDVAKLNDVIRNKDEEIYSFQKEVTALQEEQQRSKPLSEYNELEEELQNKDMLLNEMHSKFEDSMRENSELLMKIDKLSQENDDTEHRLIQKEQDLADTMAKKEHLEAEITELERDKSDAERRIWELQGTLENNAKHVEDLQTELRNVYKQLELLKAKHTEDTEMQNHRLEGLIEELSSKTQENEVLTNELEEKEKLVGQNMTEEARLDLEATISELNQQLAEANEKIQAQREKMKKIAANLKKKTTICQELEARVAELEEKWTMEKDEKEAKNTKIQEVEKLINEKDDRISILEQRLLEAEKEIAEHVGSIEKQTHELTVSQEKTSLLVHQITEMEEEIVRLRTEMNACSIDLAAAKEAKETVLSEYESCRQQVVQENDRKQVELDEVKEKARELSVRMQVMETEYVEQLGLIKNLKAENGLLLSKQAQINEKLENVEKESEERRLLIDQLQKDIVSTASASTQTTEDETTEDDTRIPGVQHCDYCEQCQTLVQALEAKLHEREAEIENLDNELANSIGNFVQMRESLRFNDLMNQSSLRNRNLEDPYNELLLQYNALTTSNDETKTELSNALTENKELMKKIEGIQSANAALGERLQKEVEEGRERAERLQRTDSLNAELIKKCEEREAELSNMQKEIQVVLERADYFEKQLNSHMTTFEAERQQLLETEKSLLEVKVTLEQEVESLKAERNSSEERIKDLEVELERQKQQSVETKEDTMTSRNEMSPVKAGLDEQDNAPKLFDASKIFGTSQASDTNILTDKEVTRLQRLLDEREAQCSNITQVIDHLERQMTEERSQLSEACNRYSEELRITQEQLHTARTEIERLDGLLIVKNQEVQSLNVKLSNVTTKITEYEQQWVTDDNLQTLMFDNDNQTVELRAELNATKETLERLIAERDQHQDLLDSYKIQISNLEAELRNSSDVELIQDLEHRISVILKERDLLQLQVSDFSRSMEELKDSTEGRRNLQVEVENALRERDEAKELIANLTQALKESRKTQSQSAAQTSTKESASVEERIVSSRLAQPVEDAKLVEESVERTTQLDVGSTWDTGSTERLNVDEESWGWNADDVQLTGEEHLTATLVPSVEVQLRAQVDDLQDRIKDLEAEKEKIAEENKTAQIRSGKMVKKLKEYKVQLENLQQQLKMQKSTSDFYELDSAIEEELKSQIRKLEKALSDLREEQRSTIAEKEALMKRLNVVISANERYMEVKERQDMDMEVLRIQNKELNNKIQALDKRLQENVTNVDGAEVTHGEDQADVESQESNQPSGHGQPRKRSVEQDENLEALCKKYKDEIDDLKDEMEALATENEQLQHFLEEQKAKLVALESKTTEDENESIQIVEELNKRTVELQRMLSKSKEEYDVLRKQYEQSLMDANDQVSAMRLNSDFLKAESHEKISKIEMEANHWRGQAEASSSKANDLAKSLQDVHREKVDLEEKVSALMVTEEKFSSISTSLAEVTDLLNIRIQEVAELKQELQRQYIDREQSEAKLQHAIQTLTQQFNEKKQELESLKQSCSEKEKELIQQQSVESASAIVSQATQELVQKHVIEIEEKEKEIRNLAEKVSTLQIAVDEYSLDAQNNVAVHAAQQQDLEILKHQLAEKDSLLESVQSSLSSMKLHLSNRESEFARYEEESQNLKVENARYSDEISSLQRTLNESHVASSSVHEYSVRVQSLEQEVEVLRRNLNEKELTLQRYTQESEERAVQLESYTREISQLRGSLKEIDILRNALQNKTDQVNDLSTELEAAQRSIEEAQKSLSEKLCLLESTNQTLNEKQKELDRLSTATQHQQYSSSSTVGSVPFFRMGDDETAALQNTIDTLNAALDKKNDEIGQLKYILNENTYPSMIQEMQDRINMIYNEKAELESQLAVTTQVLKEKEKQIEDLKLRLEVQNQEMLAKDDAGSLSRDRRSLQDEQEIVKLQDELHVKEQEINELKYIIAQNESRLCLQASMESQSDNFELREMVERLTGNLHGKEQEVHHLKSIIAELQAEILRLGEFERLSQESQDAIQRLSSEKENIRLEADEILERKLKEKEAEIVERKLKEKEAEIDEVKQRLQAENRKILEELQLRDKDVENLRRQLEESSDVEQSINAKLHEKEEELLRVNVDLAEKERRLAEVSITKDAELHNLKVQIHEKEVRIEELIALSEEEEKQLAELRNCLVARETEVNTLKTLLEDKIKEYELIQHALKKDVPLIDVSPRQGADNATEGKSDVKDSTSHELDLALYMLHQRDVRCEELTHELMQLLEERDTLQLRLSNAIRVNEELRRAGGKEESEKQEASQSSESEEPLIEHPSPSKSEGPIEIAKEAIDAPIGENKEALALKLSQLHTVSHAKDVRLRDERELRHTQQMSLLAHKDVLSTLPPEAAARLVNANYTLSRDVQSQSSVLLNWLWGKRDLSNVTDV